MKHTKGEWEVITIDLADYKQACIASKSEEDVICHLHLPDGITDKIRANAKLIAAAPDLLDALNELIQVKDWKDSHGKDAFYIAHQPIAWEKARKAIQKATT